MNLITFNCKILVNTQRIYNIPFNYDEKTTQSLLETLENHNILINYQCRSGYCGSCRAILIQGYVKYYQEPLTSKNFSKEIFTCCCYPVTHIILQI